MVKCLNNGYITLIEHMGGDHSVIRNARRCWRSEDKSTEKSDANLIRHLIKAGHYTPFESVCLTFDVKCPLFVARQWFRHRIGSYNEESLRYCVAERDYYIPDNLNNDLTESQLRNMDWSTNVYNWIIKNEESFDLYEDFVLKGMPKEQARALLPLGTYTKFYWTVNGSSLMNFLALRMDKHAQSEIRAYAHAILHIVREVAPVSFGEWDLIKGVKL